MRVGRTSVRLIVVAMLWYLKYTARADDRSSFRTHVRGSIKDSLHEPLPSNSLFKVEIGAGRDRLLAPNAEELDSQDQ